MATHRNPDARNRHFRAAALTTDDLRRQPRPEPRRSRTRAARRAAILADLTQNGFLIMHFANHYDIARFLELTDDGSTPNAHRLARVLESLANWADSNSDGWHSWPKPVRAAGGIITRLEALERAWRTGGFITDIGDTETTKALAPVKAFLTRQRVDERTRAAILAGPTQNGL